MHTEITPGHVRIIRVYTKDGVREIKRLPTMADIAEDIEHEFKQKEKGNVKYTLDTKEHAYATNGKRMCEIVNFSKE